MIARWPTSSAHLIRLTDRGTLSAEEQQAIQKRLRGTSNLADMRDVDLVIEAAPEDYAIKKDLFEQLSRVTRPETILASNTSFHLADPARRGHHQT